MYQVDDKIRIVKEFEEFKGLIDDFINMHNISRTALYTWRKRYGRDNILDVTNEVKLLSSTNEIVVEISGVNIHCNNNYDESLLLNIIKSLKKI